MQLFYGAYPFTQDATRIQAHQKNLFNQGGQRHAYVLEFKVESYLYVTSQADCSRQMILLEAALAVPYQNLVFKHSDGSYSALVMPNVGSTTGVTCVDGPNFTDNYGAIFATEQHFDCTFRAEYPSTGSGNYFISFTESLSFSGGGRRVLWMESINSPPQRQVPCLYTPYRATQRGTAVGYRKRPPIAAPIWPAFLKEQNPQLDEKSPDRKGNVPAQYDHFERSWSYSFESGSPLVGVPHLWIK